LPCSHKCRIGPFLHHFFFLTRFGYCSSLFQSKARYQCFHLFLGFPQSPWLQHLYCIVAVGKQYADINRTCSISDGIFQFCVSYFLRDIAAKRFPFGRVRIYTCQCNNKLEPLVVHYSECSMFGVFSKYYQLISIFTCSLVMIYSFFLALLLRLGFGMIDCTCFPVFIEKSCRRVRSLLEMHIVKKSKSFIIL
jgi:hypothetical protein